MTKVLLYSGGTDSWLIDKLWKPDVKLYINIHGRYSEEEMKLLPPDVKIVDIPFLGTTEVGKEAFVPLRNLYFLMIASTYGDELCLGAVAGDIGCPDKTPTFLQDTEKLINQCIGKDTGKSPYNYKVCMDFVGKSKFELLADYLKNGGDLDYFVKNTFSCHNPVDGKECWGCKCCYKKFLQAFSNGYEFGDEVEKKMIQYFKDVEFSNDFGSKYFIFDRPKEGKDMEKAVRALFKKHGLDVEDYLCNIRTK